MSYVYNIAICKYRQIYPSFQVFMTFISFSWIHVLARNSRTIFKIWIMLYASSSSSVVIIWNHLVLLIKWITLISQIGSCFELALPGVFQFSITIGEGGFLTLNKQEPVRSIQCLKFLGIHEAKTWPLFSFTSPLACFFPLILSEIKEKGMEKSCLSQTVPYLKCSSLPLSLVLGMFPPATNPQKKDGWVTP